MAIARAFASQGYSIFALSAADKATRCWTPDDAQYVRAVLDQLEADAGPGVKRVAVGGSIGAAFLALLALITRFVAIAQMPQALSPEWQGMRDIAKTEPSNLPYPRPRSSCRCCARATLRTRRRFQRTSRCVTASPLLDEGSKHVRPVSCGTQCCLLVSCACCIHLEGRRPSRLHYLPG